eukprot:CAMPEP_0194751830 /NCGR_PEP_ID=MMETSP0323_2-20130528/5769_1 /TAXON_ID=2866 ORGANISM="Crypthecodinium cohnii, Strain Seligo" /NCGR_SAMPLE_ID=MMETSP0323_2 /ASSEMBLY_ACC=CAM_ASM_000346 /LENGTH=91 /DNA_ID=CAMNT_0039668475 /DNA_START=70 /DNA_END=345 /DNA_ORIENTATION=-
MGCNGSKATATAAAAEKKTILTEAPLEEQKPTATEVKAEPEKEQSPAEGKTTEDEVKVEEKTEAPFMEEKKEEVPELPVIEGENKAVLCGC